MEIIDLEQHHEKLYFACLEDWSDDMKDAGDHKQRWYEVMKNKGLRVKLAKDEKGEIGGMIQYIPIEHSFVEGKGLYFINCIWVHGHKDGRGNFQNQGMGKALLNAAEEDARQLNAKGIAAWGMLIPVFMRAKWFKKQGYKKVARNGIMSLLWKPFTEDAVPPKWIKAKKKPALTPDKVTVTALINGWCPVQSINAERAKRAASEFGDKVIFNEISTLDRNTFLEWGISDTIFIEEKDISSGPPLTYDKIKKRIAKKVKKL
jgi:GNAT superfamily N-acetyltransferase